MSWITGLGKLIASLPAIIKLLQACVDAYNKHLERKVLKRYEEKRKAITLIEQQLKTAKTKEERDAIARRLSIILNP